MLFHLLLVIFILFIIFSYFGAKLHTKIKDFEHKYLFWILFIITIVTVIEIIFCFMMWFKYKNKEGSIGPRGFQGEPGPKGDIGKCDKNCNVKLISILFINMIEKNEKKSLTETEKNNIYENFKALNTEFKRLYSLTNKNINTLYNNLLLKYDNDNTKAVTSLIITELNNITSLNTAFNNII